MTEQLKLHWATSPSDYPLGGTGNVYGYWTHNRHLLEEVWKIADITEDAEDALTIMSAESFKPVRGKTNWLFTMWEGMDTPTFYREKMFMADYLIAPSKFVKKVFEKDLYGVVPVFVVPHGVSDRFTYQERSLPKKKGDVFRFLWAGAPNTRKGWEECLFAWSKAGFGKAGTAELYLKTTGVKKFENEVFHDWEKGVVYDYRDLSPNELLDLYHSAHCFLLPTRGEGFGLTLAEAMRTGVPCIATGFGGVTEFFDDEVGYPIEHFIATAEFTFHGRSGCLKTYSRIGMPEVGHLVHLMFHVIQNYDEALDKAFKAHQRIRDDFTWAKSAKTLVQIIGARTQ